MEPEAYQQAVSEGVADTARMLDLFIRVAVRGVIIAVCLVVFFWGRDFILDGLNRFFASDVATRLRWLSPRPLLVYWISGVTLAAGVYLAAFSLDGERWRRSRRFWQRTPVQIEDWFDADVETSQRENLFADRDRDAYDRAVTISRADRRKRNRRKAEGVSSRQKRKQ